MNASKRLINVAVESELDLAVVGRLINSVGCELGQKFVRRKKLIRDSINGFNESAKDGPWFILVDLDEEIPCAPALVSEWLTDKSPLLCLRVAVREVESWLLADTEKISRYLGIPIEKIPSSPDEVEWPKEQLIKLARLSTDRKVKSDLIPTPESGRTEGKGYRFRLTAYVHDEARGWRPEVAAQNSPSLKKAIDCLIRLSELP